jgi:hypothetical protein
MNDRIRALGLSRLFLYSNVCHGTDHSPQAAIRFQASKPPPASAMRKNFPL